MHNHLPVMRIPFLSIEIPVRRISGLASVIASVQFVDCAFAV
jgi:hypothetical protein